MTASQIKALSPAGEIVLPERVIKAKDPHGYAEASYYRQHDGTLRRVILDKKGDTGNIRLPEMLGEGEERIGYDNERGTRGNTGAT